LGSIAPVVRSPALTMGRRAVGAELKRSYYDQAVRNLAAAVSESTSQLSMF